MTIKVIPSTGREVTHQSVSAAARWGGSDWIVPASEDLNAGNEGLYAPAVNDAAISTSGLDVTIDTFEAFIGGAWLGSDDNTHSEHTHTLAGNATTTTLFLGYDHSATDTFIFGPASEFAAADPKIPIADVVDDGTAVTTTRDRRPTGLTQSRGVLLDSTYDADTTTNLTLDTGTLSDTYDQYDICIYREAQTGNENYQRLRVNGSTSSIYYTEAYDALNNTHTSIDATTQWERIAGVQPDDDGGWSYQVIRLTSPRPVVGASAAHYPLISTVEKANPKNNDFAMQGSFRSDGARISRIYLYGGDASTGFVEIYGRSLTHGTEAWY